MNIEEARRCCLLVAGAEETMPFGDEDLVYKVMGNMFALLDLNHPDFISLKCDAERAIELREHYEGVEPAWHFNKKYWNQVWLNRDVEDKMIEQLIRHSVDEVVKKWTKKKQKEYAELVSSLG